MYINFDKNHITRCNNFWNCERDKNEKDRNFSRFREQKWYGVGTKQASDYKQSTALKQAEIILVLLLKERILITIHFIILKKRVVGSISRNKQALIYQYFM